MLFAAHSNFEHLQAQCRAGIVECVAEGAGDYEDNPLFDVRTAPRDIEMKLLLDDPCALLDFPMLFSATFVMNRKPTGSSFPLEQLAVEV